MIKTYNYLLLQNDIPNKNYILQLKRYNLPMLNRLNYRKTHTLNLKQKNYLINIGTRTVLCKAKITKDNKIYLRYYKGGLHNKL